MDSAAKRDLLREIESGVVRDYQSGMVAGEPPTPLVVTISGMFGLGVATILDLRLRLLALKQAVTTAQAWGYVFLYDGTVEVAPGTHVEALISVRACQHETPITCAYYYTRSALTGVVFDKVETREADPKYVTDVFALDTP